MSVADERRRVQEHLLTRARVDHRITSAAVVGSLAHGEGDEWSDVDVTFGVAENSDPQEVLRDWTDDLAQRFDAVRLLDVPAGSTIYRVFLLPGGLQVDISFAHQSDFAATSPDFKLVLGRAAARPYPRPRASELFGWGVLYAIHARSSIGRGRLWQARYFIWNVGHRALDLACLRLCLPAHHGKGYDALPISVRDRADAAFVSSLHEAALLDALNAGTSVLMHEAQEAGVSNAAEVESRLLGLL